MKATLERPRRRETKKLAVLLGANSTRLLPSNQAVGHRAEGIRFKLLIAAIALLGLCLWGLWREFF